MAWPLPRIRSKAQLFDFELTNSNMRVLDALDRTNGSARDLAWCQALLRRRGI